MRRSGDLALGASRWPVKPTLLVTIACILLAPAISLAQPKKIAVLDFMNDAGLTRQEAEYLSDLVRGEALNLPRNRYFVMTKENLMELLPPGTDLATCQEGQCEVEAGRKVGADHVVTGRIIKFGTSLKVSMKMHNTETAALEASDKASGKSVDDLESSVIEAARRIFSKLPGGAHLAGGAVPGPGGVGAPVGAPAGATPAELEARRQAELARQRAGQAEAQRRAQEAARLKAIGAQKARDEARRRAREEARRRVGEEAGKKRSTEGQFGESGTAVFGFYDLGAVSIGDFGPMLPTDTLDNGYMNISGEREYSGETTNLDESNVLRLTPMFGYFLIDNLELGVALVVNYIKTTDDDNESETTLKEFGLVAAPAYYISLSRSTKIYLRSMVFFTTGDRERKYTGLVEEAYGRSDSTTDITNTAYGFGAGMALAVGGDSGGVMRIGLDYILWNTTEDHSQGEYQTEMKYETKRLKLGLDLGVYY